MELKDMLLFSSLKHLDGITERKEKEYWNNGILTLCQLSDLYKSQVSIYTDNSIDIVTKSINDIVNGNVDEILTKLFKKTKRKDFYRVAYSFPEDVMFLDIETTGLSKIYHYVTLIGWVINGKYEYWIQGMDKCYFINAFNSAKLIITFNGLKFDCPFLDRHFDSIHAADKPNIDLMNLSRPYGYTKGQKVIENKIGFKRPNILKKHDGREAVALWYKFLFGDDQSLYELMLYNYYDILGMMFIFDHIFFKHIYGNKFPKVGNPIPFYNGVTEVFANALNISISTDRIREYIKQRYSNFNMKNLATGMEHRIVGIDLAGVIKKSSKTGMCTLDDKIANTSIVQDDSEIIDYINKTKPDIVSIDAPLSLPKGRITVCDDDPGKDEFGIMRYCERELKRRGVNVYPALIKSMQQLTKRGIELSAKIRRMGYPVIECFPGAAQDVLQLTRKRTDESLLKTGLLRLGIHGDFENRKVYHDELDAITAALVGQFFISEYYEPIGVEEENDLILPQTKKHLPKYDLVIGVTGPISAGKTTVCNYIEQKGYAYCRYSQIIKGILDDKKISADRKTLQNEGWDLFSNMDQYKLNKLLEKRVEENALVVIDGLRHPEDYTYWKEQCFNRFFLIYVDADYEVCSARYKASHPNEHYDEVICHPVESEVVGLKQYANAVIFNNGTQQELSTAIDNAIESFVLK